MKKSILTAVLFFGATAAVAHDGVDHSAETKKATPAAPATPATPVGDHAHDSPHGGLTSRRAGTCPTLQIAIQIGKFFGRDEQLNRTSFIRHTRIFASLQPPFEVDRHHQTIE